MYNINPLKIDIGYLLNAYNLVGGSTSTFLRQIILLNNNIKIIWDFIFEKRSKLDINVTFNSFNNNKNIRKYIMYSSNNYYEKMKPWMNNQSQRDLMINDNCPNSFILF